MHTGVEVYFVTIGFTNEMVLDDCAVFDGVHAQSFFYF
jgi:hypothetical protein